jgi:hypothetical protein
MHALHRDPEGRHQQKATKVSNNVLCIYYVDILWTTLR